jgi:hypothetical protein
VILTHCYGRVPIEGAVVDNLDRGEAVQPGEVLGRRHQPLKSLDHHFLVAIDEHLHCGQVRGAALGLAKIAGATIPAGGCDL